MLVVLEPKARFPFNFDVATCLYIQALILNNTVRLPDMWVGDG